MYDTATSQMPRRFAAETSYVVPKPGGGYRAVATFKWGYTSDIVNKTRMVTLLPVQKNVTPSPFQTNLIKSAQ